MRAEMWGQDRNIVDVSYYFLYERIPASSAFCAKKKLFSSHFILIYSFTITAQEWALQSPFPFSFFGLRFLPCARIYATGTNVSLTFLKMIKRADTPCQFIRQVLITASKSHCLTGFITTRQYQLAVGVYKMKSVDQVLQNHPRLNVSGVVHILHLTLSSRLAQNM